MPSRLVRFRCQSDLQLIHIDRILDQTVYSNTLATVQHDFYQDGEHVSNAMRIDELRAARDDESNFVVTTNFSMRVPAGSSHLPADSSQLTQSSPNQIALTQIQRYEIIRKKLEDRQCMLEMLTDSSRPFIRDRDCHSYQVDILMSLIESFRMKLICPQHPSQYEAHSNRASRCMKSLACDIMANDCLGEIKQFRNVAALIDAVQGWKRTLFEYELIDDDAGTTTLLLSIPSSTTTATNDYFYKNEPISITASGEMIYDEITGPRLSVLAPIKGRMVFDNTVGLTFQPTDPAYAAAYSTTLLDKSEYDTHPRFRCKSN